MYSLAVRRLRLNGKSNMETDARKRPFFIAYMEGVVYNHSQWFLKKRKTKQPRIRIQRRTT